MVPTDYQSPRGASKMSSFVAVVRYRAPLKSVKPAVDLCRGLEPVTPGMRVFIKPTIVFWTKATTFPKWGVIITSRVVEGMVGATLLGYEPKRVPTGLAGV
jgi:uncharacterized protein (DUF362 family)